MAEFGELQQPVEHFQHRGAAKRPGAALVEQFETTRVDRVAVGGDVPDVRKVLRTDLRPGLAVELLEFLDETALLRRWHGHGGGK